MAPRKKRKKKNTSLKSIESKLIEKRLEQLEEIPVEQTDDVNDYINNIIDSSIKQYQHIVDQENQDIREDFTSLQNIATEFLSDFIIIGHTPDDRRVIMRYAPTQGGLDKLSELCKKVLIRAMIQEERGQD